MSLKINKRQFKKWIAALDSGEYKQGRLALQVMDTYCCLGVGCKVLIPKNKQYKSSGFLIGKLPGAQMHAPRWLKEISSDFGSKTGGSSLASFNDSGELTFPEIATLLELVYVHKMLD